MSKKRRGHPRHHGSGRKSHHGRQFLQRELEERGWTAEMRKQLLPLAGRVNVPDGRGGATSERFWWERDVLAAEEGDDFRRLRQQEINKQKRRERQMAEFCRRMEQLSVSVAPRDDYPMARAMKRHFILHVGPTNSGKTYQALERLKRAESGVYLGPLRLLALEIYDRFHSEGIPCAMVTGEEAFFDEDACVTACTIEMMDTTRTMDVAVIDEAQMIADPFRGHNWTRAILGVCADEIHVCMAPEALPLVEQMITSCEDDYEVVWHERKTPLIFRPAAFRLKDVRRGDALIVFSRRAVLELAAALEGMNIRASVIYGDLPPTSRREQVRRFMEGESDVVVSTDAIGMGMNLAIHRIIFAESRKFDGVEYRLLRPTEIKQIAGRAGRFGQFDEGIVLAMKDGDTIRAGLEAKPDSIETAYLGFPEILLGMEGTLRHILSDWSQVPTEGFYQKMDMAEMLTLHDALASADRTTFGLLDKETLYRMITCSVNIKNEAMVAQWIRYCQEYLRSRKLSPPTPCDGQDLRGLENEYHCLDLYFQFGRRLSREYDYAYILRRRAVLEEAIDEQLLRGKRKYARKCEACGGVLPYGSNQKLCRRCFAKLYGDVLGSAAPPARKAPPTRSGSRGGR